MVRVSGEMIRRILSYVKARRGCSLQDLVHIVPEHYRYFDMPDEYLVLEGITNLVRWGLVEAYLDGNLVDLVEIEKFNRWELPQKAEFYVAPQTIEIEEVLGIRLDAAGQQIFGEPERFRYRWPEKVPGSSWK